MAKKIIIPDMNVLHFAELNYNFPDNKWGQPAYGDALQWDYDSFFPNRIRKQQFFKVTPDQPICLQYKRGRAGDGTDVSNPTELYIYNYNTKAFIKYLNIQSSAILPGDIDADGEQLYTEQFLFSTSQHAELNNLSKLFFVLRIYYGDSTVIDYASEPVHVKDKHEGTAKIEWSSRVNRDGVVFEQLQPRFCMRINSNGLYEGDASEQVGYKNQQQRTVLTYSKSTKLFKLDIGGSDGITPYQMDSLRIGMGCVTNGRLRIDGTLYIPVENSYEVVGGEGKHVKWATVDLQKTNGDSFQKGLREIRIAQLPGIYPYALSSVPLSDGIQTIGRFTAKVVDDSIAEANFINALNASVAADGVSGTFSVNMDGWLIFLNAEGENYDTYTKVYVFTKYLTLTLNASVADAGLPFTYSFGYPDVNLRYHVVCWGATSGDEELKTSGGAFGSFITVSKGYATTGTKTVRIFHGNQEAEFQSLRNNAAPSFARTPSITNITGDAPSSLLNFRLRGHTGLNALTNFDISFLNPARDVLKYLTLDTCGIKGIADGWAQNLVSGTYKPWQFLRTIEIITNSFTSTRVDAFFNEMYNHMKYTAGGMGNVRIKYNSPSAPPTSASDTARAALISALWTVSTD